MNAVTETRIRAIVQSAETEHDLRTAFDGMSHFEIGIVRGRLQDHGPDWLGPQDVLIVDVSMNSPEDMAALERTLLGEAPPTVIVTSASASVADMRQLIRLGVADYLPQPITHNDVLGVVRSVRARMRPGPDRPHHDCQVFSFVRRSGGMGATSLAIQAAFELARNRRGQTRRKICLVDLDFQGGAAWLHLDAEPLLDIAEIIRSPHRLDAQLLTSMTVHHAAGFDFIAAPNATMNPDSVPADVVGHLMSLVCESYDCVIVDLPLSWARWTEEILSGSDRIFLAIQLTVVAVKQAHLFLEQIKQTSAAQTPIAVVLNRYRRSWWRPGLKVREAERALGYKVDYFIPSDYRLFSEAANHGLPIGNFHAGSGAEKQIAKMMQSVLKRAAAARPAQKGK
ncbi:MAG: AAA family ATPase [Dongiaceae bacterium]